MKIEVKKQSFTGKIGVSTNDAGGSYKILSGIETNSVQGSANEVTYGGWAGLRSYKAATGSPPSSRRRIIICG